MTFVLVFAFFAVAAIISYAYVFCKFVTSMVLLKLITSNGFSIFNGFPAVHAYAVMSYLK